MGASVQSPFGFGSDAADSANNTQQAAHACCEQGRPTGTDVNHFDNAKEGKVFDGTYTRELDEF